MDIKDYYCRYCIFHKRNIKSPTGYICTKYNLPKKEEDFCSENIKRTLNCDSCGRKFIASDATIIADDNLIICPECARCRNLCVTCKNFSKCDFETNPSTLPKVVQKQVRRGNMTSVTQIRNPERVRITCQNGCPCYHSEFDCCKQNHGTCQQYHMNRV